MSEPYDIVVSGHICLDLIPDLSRVAPEAVAAPGHLTETGALSVCTGGAVSNTGLALHRLGARVGLMGVVGDDAIGTMTRAFLERREPALSRLMRVRPGQGSSYSVVLAPQGRDRSFLHHPGPNATFGVDDVDFAAARDAKIFHLGYPPIMPRLIEGQGAELREIFERVKRGGVVTSMDMVVPDANAPSGRADWPAILAKTLPHVDVFLPSLEEALFMLRRAEYDAWRGEATRYVSRDFLHALTGELLAMGVAVAGVKLGELGLYLRTGDAAAIRRLDALELDAGAWVSREYWQGAYQADVKGTTGAGDAAYAGFLAALLQGLPPQACLQWASAVGACSVETVDAVSGVRTWDETARRIEAGWSTLPHRLPGYEPPTQRR